jgi:hypothetical protein
VSRPADGAANRLQEEESPSPPAGARSAAPAATLPQTVAAARAAPADARATLTGSVTLPPGLIPKTIFIEDATGAGYQIIPRFRSDLSNAQVFLPVTGGTTGP